MNERIVIIDKVDPQTFYGVNNNNINLIRNLFPKLRMAARGNVIKVIGEESETGEFERKVKEIENYASTYNKLTEDVIIDIIKGEPPKPVNTEGVIIFGQTGRPIAPRNANQAKMVRSFAHNDLTFALGPAGTGKTYIAIALAVAALKNKACKRIILSRPAVEAGEKLGFLPGDMKDKIDPYLRPLYDALEDMLPQLKLKEYMENDTIQIAPLAFMRGRTLNDAVIILDEAQNTTKHQMKMFLTRLGVNSKMIITGDATQIDLPRTVQSGLLQSLRILRGVEGIGIIEYVKKDIVRHPLVQRIVDAYESREKKVDDEFEAGLKMPAPEERNQD
ncbi:PhoH family protein [Lepagella muris]|jgi:phosphate starvation-inducible PhoH-like protein|uniref:PhoH family protein n=1 Tax=Lepagella muris TaxID=3032870 RepID=A0AC61RF97_9BACT|nr:PhoH family protein [Lepagella muris]TGY77855.1 PhoH family protein [Lepagella muris]THG51310.1 PhoH family protein [Bacteroidales bacterium]TKC64212.1 PhoH family protein [Bacteroidales bacterium]